MTDQQPYEQYELKQRHNALEAKFDRTAQERDDFHRLLKRIISASDLWIDALLEIRHHQDNLDQAIGAAKVIALIIRNEIFSVREVLEAIDGDPGHLPEHDIPF